MEKHYFDIRETLETVKTSTNLLVLFTCLKYFPIAVLMEGAPLHRIKLLHHYQTSCNAQWSGISSEIWQPYSSFYTHHRAIKVRLNQVLLMGRGMNIWVNGRWSARIVKIKAAKMQSVAQYRQFPVFTNLKGEGRMLKQDLGFLPQIFSPILLIMQPTLCLSRQVPRDPLGIEYSTLFNRD